MININNLDEWEDDWWDKVVLFNLITGKVCRVFKKARKGKLKIEKWFMDRLFKFANPKNDGHSISHERLREEEEADAVIGLALRSGMEAEAQDLINRVEDRWYNYFDDERKSKCDRNIFVGDSTDE